MSSKIRQKKKKTNKYARIARKTLKGKTRAMWDGDLALPNLMNTIKSPYFKKWGTVISVERQTMEYNRKHAQI